MDYKIKKLEKSVVQIDINLNKEEWQKEVDSAYNRTKGKYNIEGFRKGKAPRKVIEKTYGDNVFYEDALSEAFYRAYMEILSKEKDIEPVDAPSLNVKAISADGIELEAQVVTRPEVKVTKYTGLDVKVETKKVTKAQVEEELNRAKEQNVRLVEVDRPVQNGDVANINFSGSIDGVKFDGGTAEGFDLEIGSHSFIEGFEDQLVGLKVGEDKDVNVTFPENYHAKDLAGKPAVFACHINAVKEKQYPELNDEFASNVSEFETLEEYKKHLEEHIQEHMDEHAKRDADVAIIDKIVENTEVEVPNQMVEGEIDNMLRDLEYRLMYQGLNLDAYMQYMNTTLEKYRETLKAEALKSVKVRLALSYILEKEKINLTDAEVDAELQKRAQSANISVEQYKTTVGENGLFQVKNDILMSKLLEFLRDKNLKK